MSMKVSLLTSITMCRRPAARNSSKRAANPGTVAMSSSPPIVTISDSPGLATPPPQTLPANSCHFPTLRFRYARGVLP